MAADRTITCTNEDGFGITFTEKEFAPFLLAGVDGVYDAINTVYVSENSMIDGAIFQGSVTKYRNIVIRLIDTGPFPENRDLLNRLFKEKTRGELVFSEGDFEPRKIGYYVESFNSTAEPQKRFHEISLICPDPFFYSMIDETVDMASWLPAFEFEKEFTESGFEFGYRSPERIKTITNKYAEDNIGMTITLTSSGTVTNPSVTLIQANESIELGYASKPFNMTAGDTVIITTESGNKHVRLIRNGVTQEVNQYLTEDSTFIQLMRGENSIGFAAESGEINLSVSISYRLKYARA